MGQDLRERFSGAVEAFARRNVSSHGIRPKHIFSDDASKEVVSFSECLGSNIRIVYFIIQSD